MDPLSLLLLILLTHSITLKPWLAPSTPSTLRSAGISESAWLSDFHFHFTMQYMLYIHVYTCLNLFQAFHLLLIYLSIPESIPLWMCMTLVDHFWNDLDNSWTSNSRWLLVFVFNSCTDTIGMTEMGELTDNLVILSKRCHVIFSNIFLLMSTRKLINGIINCISFFLMFSNWFHVHSDVVNVGIGILCWLYIQQPSWTLIRSNCTQILLNIISLMIVKIFFFLSISISPHLCFLSDTLTKISNLTVKSRSDSRHPCSVSKFLFQKFNILQYSFSGCFTIS